MKAVVAAFNQEKALVGAFSVIVQPVVEPMDRFAALSPYLPGSLVLLAALHAMYGRCQPRDEVKRGEAIRSVDS